MAPPAAPPIAGRTRPAVVATLVSLLLAAFKCFAWLLTGSVAMLASMVDSAADAVVSFGNLMALRAAARPADREHPFGHGAIEDLAALLQSLLIAASGVFVVTTALARLVEETTPLRNAFLGMGAAIISIVVAWLLARTLRRAGQVHDSPALEADSEHYTSDYLANLGVLIAFVGWELFDQPLLDPAISVCIAFVILRTAWERFSTAANSIMDRELDEENLKAIDETVRSFKEVRGYHDLLTRRSGPDRFIQLHMAIDASLTFREAHAVTERVSRAIEALVPRSRVTIHSDPWPEDPEDAQTHLPYAPEHDFAREDDHEE